MKMQNIAKVLLLVSFSLAIESVPVTPNYIGTGDCKGEQFCSYSYSAHQEHFNENDAEQTLEVTATVDVTCTSSGLYNDSDAKLYCMSIKNVNIMSNLLENSTDEEIRTMWQFMNNQLGNWFCFVQSYNGKIPAVYHSPSEPDHVITLKKAIAAAFQANFEGTDEEEETDPQSRHISHYTYTPTSEQEVLKMKRTIRRDDVSEYSNEVTKDDIDTTKDEEIQYRSGRLEKSSGVTTFHLVNNSYNDSDLESFSLSQAFSASGSYKMELQACRRVNNRALGVQKKRIFSEMKRDSKEEGLTASVNKEKEGTEEMKMLREKLPSGSALKALQNYEVYGDKLVQVLQVLLELESQYGTLPQYTPVIDEIMTFIAKMSPSKSNKDVREDVIMLLSTEGSLKSQLALLTAYDSALDNIEANTILTHISFMERVRIGFVIGMEERLNHPSGDKILSDQLLLVFGSLAMKGTTEVEDRVINYLKGRVSALTIKTDEADLSDVILLLHAFGNTGSKTSISLVFSILNASIELNSYDKIEFGVIEALSKVTDDPLVLTKLEQLLLEHPSLECIASIIETLENGFDYIEQSKQDVQEYTNTITAHSIVFFLASAVASTNDTDLHNIMEHYLRKIKASEAIFALIYSDDGPLRNRVRRATTDWRSTASSDYNYVESLSTRQFDVSTYDQHQAYISSKTIGVDKANVKIAYGYFAGTNSPCTMMKAFGRTIVVGTLLSHTSTLADVKIDMRVDLNQRSASVVAFARIGSNTLLDYTASGAVSTHCRQFTRSLSGFRVRLLHLSFSIPIYIGSITLSLDLYVHFDLGANANFCLGRSTTEVSGALGSLTPTVGVTVTGGVRATLAYLIRGGVDVSVTLNYRLEPAASIQGCPAFCSLSGRMCIGLYDSNHGSNIRLEAYYQIQSVRVCGRRWFRYPCIRWGNRHTWDALSHTWSIGRQARRALWQRCTGNLHPSCASTALSSPLFVG